MAQKVARYINPVLAALKVLGGAASPKAVYSKVAADLGLADSILDETRKDGRPVFENQVAWARMYLVRTGYIDRSKRGVWTLTEKGRKSPTLSDKEVHKLLRSVQRDTQHTRVAVLEVVDVAEEREDPDEDMLQRNVSESYRQQLLDLMGSLPPSGFERLCQRLLWEAEFEDVTVTGKSGDGGIDGIGVLKVNHFVTFKVLFQCKRWKSAVGSAQVRDFRGAMSGRADKGMILTTGSFSAEAQREAVRDGVPPIELIGGDELIDLFEKLELGLKPRKTYDLDFEFFKEFQE
ncbi:MAG: restriction endonuclease [Planctomycetaceae bacterium]